MKSFSSRTFLLEFWEERGEKLMTCHLFLDNFFLWNFMTFCFSKVKSFETDFCFKKTQISRFRYHEISVFLKFVFSQKTFYRRKLIVFSCLQFADCYIWSRILSCGVIFCFNHCYGIFFFEKFSFRQDCHGFANFKIMVLSKTCVRFRNRIFKRFE